MKSRIINIIIIVLALALIIFMLVKKSDKNSDNLPVDENVSETEDTNTGDAMTLPTPPVESWTPTTAKDESVTYNLPKEYYVSHPVIGGCEDVTSISTQTSSIPTVSIALIYKDGCVTDTDVTTHFTKREVKGGYVFQTSSTNASVLKIFDQIVASAQVK